MFRPQASRSPGTPLQQCTPLRKHLKHQEHERPNGVIRLAGVASVLLAVVLLLLPAPVRAEHLELLEVQHEGAGGVDGLAGVLAVVLSPDGSYLYAAGPSDNAVAVFRRDKTSGGLTPVQVVKDGVGGVDGIGFASALAISPDGAQLYVTGSHDGALAVFRRNTTTGALDFLEAQKNGVNGVAGLAFARGVTLSPDGAFVYVASETDNAIAIFRRNPMLGTLVFVQAVRDDADGGGALAAVLSVAVSPDGAHLYSAGNSSVAVFQRAADSGALTFVEAQKETADGPRFGILGTHSLTMSPDGAFVYASGQADDAVAVFRRERTTGKLTFIQVEAQDVDGTDGLVGALWVALSPDGKRVYVTGSTGSSVAAFTRDPASGALAFLEAVKAADGVSGIAFARAAVVSPDGKFVYVGGASSNAIAVFGVTSD